MRLAACAPPPKIWISGNGSTGRVRRKVTPERTAVCRRRGMKRRHRDRDQRVAAQLALVGCAVGVHQQAVDTLLVFGVGPRQRPRDAPIDVRDGAAHVKSIGVPEVHRLARSRGRSGGRNRATCRAALQFHLSFHRRTAARVPNAASADKANGRGFHLQIPSRAAQTRSISASELRRHPDQRKRHLPHQALVSGSQVLHRAFPVYARQHQGGKQPRSSFLYRRRRLPTHTLAIRHLQGARTPRSAAAPPHGSTGI